MIYSRQTIEELYELTEAEWSCRPVGDRMWVTKVTGTQNGKPFIAQIASRGREREAAEKRCVQTIALDALLYAIRTNESALDQLFKKRTVDNQTREQN